MSNDADTGNDGNDEKRDDGTGKEDEQGNRPNLLTLLPVPQVKVIP
jgi:hypothetical protein